jgi:acyl carrier protein
MPQDLISEERVIEELKKCIAESLRIHASTITPESSLVEELGAESLDLLDINYRLEKAFGIKMARYFVLEHVEELFGEGAALDQNGRLTQRGLEILKIRLSNYGATLKTGMDLSQINALITVRSIARGVMDILGTLPEQCTSCTRSAWQLNSGGRIVCGECGREAQYTSGDDLIKIWLAKIQAEKQIF